MRTRRGRAVLLSSQIIVALWIVSTVVAFAVWLISRVIRVHIAITEELRGKIVEIATKGAPDARVFGGRRFVCGHPRRSSP